MTHQDPHPADDDAESLRPATSTVLYGLPFRSRTSPLAATAAQANGRWASAVGLVRADRASWLADCAPHLAAARMYPDAQSPRLALVTAYLTWLFVLDDRLDHDPADSTAGSRTLAELATVLGCPPSTAPPEPLLRALADIRRRTRELVPRTLSQRLDTHLRQTVDAFATEAEHRRDGRPPSENQYIDLRRRTSCAWIFADLAELAHDTETLPLLHTSAEYHAQVACAADIAGWDNDLVSLARETASDESDNLVTVLARRRGWTPERAGEEVARRIGQRVREYPAAERRTLAHIAASGLRGPERTRHEDVIVSFRDVLAGVLAWNHGDTLRFADPPTAAPRPHRTGGTPDAEPRL
ncbi:hypothetical protein SAMN05216371_8160 [Streptomyces sp. TLI_053]|uniref:terpene synthase family protein n=1 Tax=Streptomyces sp. TLI_053 TaxID=1855352 RepID=UPI00087CEE84|nr:hypothetical protein [Streptomyces sp. TLI_053]SDT83340.1 hypothetical protein SAMN05216371_8160 [Streptomyces sp. TLI_053]